MARIIRSAGGLAFAAGIAGIVILTAVITVTVLGLAASGTVAAVLALVAIGNRWHVLTRLVQ